VTERTEFWTRNRKICVVVLSLLLLVGFFFMVGGSSEQDKKRQEFNSKYPELSKYDSAYKLYCANSTLLSEVYRNCKQDPRVSIDGNNLTSLASQLYLDLNLAGKNLMLPTIHAVNNVTVANEHLGEVFHQNLFVENVGDSSAFA